MSPRSIDLGDKDNATCPTLVTLAVNQGDSIVVTNVGGDVVNYFTNPSDSGPAGTIANSSSQTFTAPAWIASQGRSSVTISGGQYGS